MDSKNFRLLLKNKMDGFVHFIYKLSKKFPDDEKYNVTSQLRRATLSIILNFIEGFARNNKKVYLNFLKISYGSLKEVEYLIDFSYKEKYINVDEFQESQNQLDQIGKMLWVLIKQ